MADSDIEWTNKVWNATRGCSRVSPGCGGAAGEGGCYAERQAARFSGPGMPYEGLVRIGKQGPRWTGQMRLVANKLAEPLGWKKPCRIFVNSMSDLFHEGLENEEIAAVFGVMAAAPQHTFQILTKRAKRMREWFEWLEGDRRRGAEGWPAAMVDPTPISGLFRMALDAMDADASKWPGRFNASSQPWPLPNVWLGVSVEDQKRADERIPDLLATPAAVRFVSYEPAIEAVRFGANGSFLGTEDIRDAHGKTRIHWLIAGAESGPGARPFDTDWARSARDQCVEAGVAFFYKQNAKNGRKIPTPELDGKRWMEFPS